MADEESYYVEDHENGTLRANGTGGPPRIDKQPIVVAALTSRAGNTQDDQQSMQLVASPLEASDGHHGHSSPRGDGADNLVVAATLQAKRGSGGGALSPDETLVATPLSGMSDGEVVGTLKGFGERGWDNSAESADRLVVPISGDALRAGEALTPSPDAEGRVRLRDPGLGIGEDGDPAFTVTGAHPGAVVAAPLTKGSATGVGVNEPGRRQEDDVNLVVQPLAFHTTQDPITGEISPALSKGNKAGWGTIGVAVSQNQRGELVETDYAHQLTGGGGKPGEGYPAARVESGVRRLTPVECERLQGLPDGWTEVPEGAPDSRRYSSLGDAVTANVAEWIGRRLLAEETR